jgi:hypothetical protein
VTVRPRAPDSDRICRRPDRERGGCTNRVSRFVFLADETLRLEIENPGVAGVIGSKRPTDESRSRLRPGARRPARGALEGEPPSEHIAMQEVDDSGSAVNWGRHVRDEEYRASPT